VGDAVTLLLAFADLERQALTFGVGAEHLVQELGRTNHVGGSPLEQPEELVVASTQALGQTGQSWAFLVVAVVITRGVGPEGGTLAQLGVL